MGVTYAYNGGFSDFDFETGYEAKSLVLK